MRYRDRSGLADIQAAIDAIHSDLQRSELTDGLIFDVVRIRASSVSGWPWKTSPIADRGPRARAPLVP